VHVVCRLGDQVVFGKDRAPLRTRCVTWVVTSIGMTPR
jgi:hypothetical protein